MSSTDEEGMRGKYECIYSGSGKTPLLSAASAFLGLAIIMVVEHGYMLYAISNSPPSVLLTWEPHDSDTAKSMKWHAAIFFVTTWYANHFSLFLVAIMLCCRTVEYT